MEVEGREQDLAHAEQASFSKGACVEMRQVPSVLQVRVLSVSASCVWHANSIFEFAILRVLVSARMKWTNVWNSLILTLCVPHISCWTFDI